MWALEVYPMDARKLLETLTVAERLKDATRHCYTARGHHESVAEHSWMMTLMAFLMWDEFPEADMDKGDAHVRHSRPGRGLHRGYSYLREDHRSRTDGGGAPFLLGGLPARAYAQEMQALYREMAARETLEAKIYKAIDSLEALIQHNISDLSTWIPREFELNKTYADDKVAFSDYLTALREEIRRDTLKKIGE